MDSLSVISRDHTRTGRIWVENRETTGLADASGRGSECRADLIS